MNTRSLLPALGSAAIAASPAVMRTAAESEDSPSPDSPTTIVHGPPSLAPDYRGVSQAHVSGREAAYLQPSFSKGQDGTESIADGAIVVSLTAAF